STARGARAAGPPPPCSGSTATVSSTPPCSMVIAEPSAFAQPTPNIAASRQNPTPSRSPTRNQATASPSSPAAPPQPADSPPREYRHRRVADEWGPTSKVTRRPRRPCRTASAALKSGGGRETPVSIARGAVASPPQRLLLRGGLPA